MSGQDNDAADRNFDPTPHKLEEARKRGEIAKSADLSTAAAYLGLLVVFLAAGQASVQSFASNLMVFLDVPDSLARPELDGSGQVHLRAILRDTGMAALSWFAFPAAAVLISLFAQRAFVVAPSKLVPKLSRISLISNAKQKFGANGLFEFSKSFVKLMLYGACLTLFIRSNLEDMVALAGTDASLLAQQLAMLGLKFLALVTLIALGIGLIDMIWQHFEHIRRNRMTRQELQDETKSSEGDPHLKQARRQKGQEFAQNQMLSEVPDADVVIVNPTHYAVALKWSRLPGSAPVCVAKGVDEVAARIREIATESGVPLHSDPPTARALHGTVQIGDEIDEAHYQAVALAIRFAEELKAKARKSPI